MESVLWRAGIPMDIIKHELAPHLLPWEEYDCVMGELMGRFQGWRVKLGWCRELVVIV